MKIDLTEDEIRIIGQLLEQAPYYLAAPIIDNINSQIKANEVERKNTEEAKQKSLEQVTQDE